MLRLTTVQPDFWDQLLPAEARRLGPELEAVGALLDDERFLATFRACFPSKRGRYTIPMETYLRLMYLKVRYGLGYESLMAEVNDSVSWRRFCRISLGGRVPDASTLIKLTNGPCKGLAEEIHTALVKQLTHKRVLRGRKLRVDTTVVEADIHYPTDVQLPEGGAMRTRLFSTSDWALLLAGGVGVPVVAIVALLAAAGGFRDVGCSIKRRLLSLGKGLKQPEGQKQATRARVTAEVLAIAQDSIHRAMAVRERAVLEAEQQRATVKRTIERGLTRLDTWLGRTQRVMEQTRQVLAGDVHIPNRLVSLFDPEARPIRKGKLSVAGGTEFGYKVVVVEEEHGFITHYAVAQGNPADGTLLVPAVEGHKQQVGRAPRAVATDRGMASAANERKLGELGVKSCSLPKTGKKSPGERAKEAAPWFRRLQRFRAGGEARISLLKRKYGWRRSRLRGREGVKTWTGWGVITHNLTRYARLQKPAAA